MAFLAAALVLSTGCAGDDPRPGAGSAADASGTSSGPSASNDVRSPEPAPASRSPSPVGKGTRVIVGNSDFGPMLYSAEGQAIYLFDLEDGPRPQCYGECAVEWPPVLTVGDPVAGRGVRANLLGTTKRRDGATQLTYAGHPLYFYAHEGLYEVLCHDFFEFGGTWYVVQPSGTAAP